MAEPILPDLLQPGLPLVICGSAAGAASARRGAYYAGPGNRFYRILHEVGLTDRILLPQQYALLLGCGIGLTDLAKTASGADAAIPRAAWDPGAVREKVLRLRPAVLAFNGKNAARRTLGLRDLPYGMLAQRMGPVALFVCPSTSGSARRHWDPAIWHALADAVRAAARAAPE